MKKFISKLPYIIAEVGHNHQGNLNKAIEMIKVAKDCGASAVKFQKRFNNKLYTKKFYNSSYTHRNSYASTYGKHRDFLEFDFEQFEKLKKYANKINIDFLVTPFDFESLLFLKKLKVSSYKIASGDLTNTPLQKEISKTGKLIFLSTGGGNLDDIKRAVKNIEARNKKLVILHCTASYPSRIEDMNLNIIEVLKKEFKKNIIGLSDHENGIDAGPLAYMLGARVFEKHFTLDRSLKGTDHSFSLEPVGLQKFVRNINRIEILLGSRNKKFLEAEKSPIYKMSKSIVASRSIKKGKKITRADIDFKSPGGGLPPYKYSEIINKRTKKHFNEDEKISLNEIE